MSYRTLSIVALAASLFTGCSKSGSQVQIVSAAYGEYTNFADVSFRVRDLIHLDAGFQVQPSFLQADPFPYYHKVLVIVYVTNGRRHILTASENDTVSTKTLLEGAKQ
jgi:hypothetical protein